MATSKKASRKSATKKKAAKGSKKRRHKGGHGGGGGGGGGIPIDIDSQDPIIVTGGGSVTLEFNTGQFQGASGNHHNSNAHIKGVVIDGRLYPANARSTIVIIV